jgi:hypothetical protein
MSGARKSDAKLPKKRLPLRMRVTDAAQDFVEKAIFDFALRHVPWQQHRTPAEATQSIG